MNKLVIILLYESGSNFVGTQETDVSRCMGKVLAGAQVKVRAARVQPRAPPTLRFSYRTNFYLLFMVLSSRTTFFCLMMTESCFIT